MAARVAVVNLGWVDGKRARKYLYGETRKEVADKLKAFTVEHADGRSVHPIGRRSATSSHAGLRT